ncbi:MAG: ABC transporter substrate-binding protein, partial [Candidatus Methylomirabilales bacterium]
MVVRGLSRREFLWLAGLAAGLGAGCRPGARRPGPRPSPGKTLGGQLKILQWSHFVPAYDQWFDKEYTVAWGRDNDVEVIVDHVKFAEIPAVAASEVAAQKGHDLVWFLSPPAQYEDQVIPHNEIVEEVERRVGKILPMVHRSTYNPRTKKYFGFSDTWAPDPVHYRKDLWDRAGFSPDSWEDILKAGPRLKAMGAPLGIGISQDIDANMALMGLMHCFGGFVQDEEAQVTISSKQTVQAVRMGAAIFKAGMTDEVFAWDASSNNRFLVDGKGSMILNAISALRTAEQAQKPFAKDILLAPIPKGPVQRLGLEHVLGTYIIWKFAEDKEAAKKFLIDLAVNYREAFIKSEGYNFPSFPGAVKNLRELISNDPRSQPPDKLAVLATAE